MMIYTAAMHRTGPHRKRHLRQAVSSTSGIFDMQDPPEADKSSSHSDKLPDIKNQDAGKAHAHYEASGEKE